MPANPATLLTPNTLVSHQQRRQHDTEQRTAGARVWESPDILPLHAWLSRTWAEISFADPVGTPVLLDTAQEEALWEQAIQPAGRDHPLLNIPQTAKTAAKAWNLLHHWEVPREASVFDGLEDTEAFFGWMTSVEAKLRENRWITSSELYKEIAARAARDRTVMQRLGRVEHVGFTEMAPAESRILSLLRSTESLLPFVEGSRVRRHQFHDAAAEWASAAMWARGCLESNPAARVGIAIPGLRDVASAVERIFDGILCPSYSLCIPSSRRIFDLSSGPRLSDVPLIAAALGILGLADYLSLPAALKLLRSPFVALAAEDKVRLDSDLRRQGPDTISIRMGTVRSAFASLARETETTPPRQSAVGWSTTFSRLLKASGWGSTTPLSDDETRALDQWKDLLSRFARLDRVIPNMTLDQALERVWRLASNSPLRTPDEDAPVQVMDLSEAGGMRFDAFWIAGLDADRWPRSIQPNPFLPVWLQRERGMPRSSPGRELELAKRLTSELSRSAQEVVFSSAKQGMDSPLIASSLIEDLEITPPRADPWLIRRVVFASGVPLQEEPLGRAPELGRGEVHVGGVKILENQAACPFKAFATHRLGAREFRETPFGVSRLERGTAAHEALNYLWAELKRKKALHERPPEELDRLISAAVEQALTSSFANRQKGGVMERFKVLERERLEHLIHAWLDEERKRPSFEVLQTEVKEEVSIGGLKLHLKADRIDEYEDGSRAILDYKTGNQLSPEMWEGERPDAPQLPLYAVTHRGGAVSEIAFAKLSSSETVLISTGCDTERLARWRKDLDALAEQYLSGYAEVDPKKGTVTCRLCQLAPLCRVAELRAFTTEDSEGSTEGSDE